MGQSEKLVQEINQVRQALQESHETLKHLTSQKSENESVLLEFSKLEDDANVWKLTGPLLVKQDREDSRINVEKRLEFIGRELHTTEEKIKNFESEFEIKRKDLVRIQNEIQANAPDASS